VESVCRWIWCKPASGPGFPFQPTVLLNFGGSHTKPGFDPSRVSSRGNIPNKFYWSDEAKEAFVDLKRLLQSNPLLASPAQSEPMLLYIAATTQVVSVVIAVEREEAGKVQ
jgi:hypothetical protein